MSRARRTGGRIAFIGAGPGDPGLLTVRAHEVLAGATLVVTDPDVSAAHHRASPTTPRSARPSGEPAEVAKSLTAAARAGAAVVRLVSGDVVTADPVVSGDPRRRPHRGPVRGGSRPVRGHRGGGVRRASRSARCTPSPTSGRSPTGAGWPGRPGSLLLQAAAGHLADAADRPRRVGLRAGDAGDDHLRCHPADPADRRRHAGDVGRHRPRDVRLAGRLPGCRCRRSGRSCRGGSRGPCTAGGCWSRRPRTARTPWSSCCAGTVRSPERVPTIAVEPPRTPAQMERAVKGLVDGRYQWIVFTSTNSVRAVWEKFTEFGLDARAFAGVKIACVDPVTGGRGARARHRSRADLRTPGVVGRPARRLPGVRRPARPGRPGAAAAGRHRHRDAGRGPARAGLGDRRRHRLPDGACRPATGDRSGRRSSPAGSRRSASPRPRPCATWSASPASRTPGPSSPASGPRPPRPRASSVCGSTCSPRWPRWPR